MPRPSAPRPTWKPVVGLFLLRLGYDNFLHPLLPLPTPDWSIPANDFPPFVVSSPCSFLVVVGPPLTECFFPGRGILFFPPLSPLRMICPPPGVGLHGPRSHSIYILAAAGDCWGFLILGISMTKPPGRGLVCGTMVPCLECRRPLCQSVFWFPAGRNIGAKDMAPFHSPVGLGPIFQTRFLPFSLRGLVTRHPFFLENPTCALRSLLR